jgi:hypothetical protein
VNPRDGLATSGGYRAPGLAFFANRGGLSVNQDSLKAASTYEGAFSPSGLHMITSIIRRDICDRRERREAAQGGRNMAADHMQRREGDKANAVADIGLALHVIDQQRRNPDTWERVYLVHALSSTFAGCYGLASTEAQLAMTPPDQRGAMPASSTDPIFDRCDLPLLMKALRAAQEEPVREFPHLGPIVLV